ncbi:uncharacterized protein LOC142348588 [Convolutriloba macropyga]|uniref:uncharacterized protein LOC142348588 n=1 Tax=Convolutriloba macropyga TaxID=536237 RepID=UPI003F51EF2C
MASLIFFNIIIIVSFVLGTSLMFVLADSSRRRHYCPRGYNKVQDVEAKCFHLSDPSVFVIDRAIKYCKAKSDGKLYEPWNQLELGKVKQYFHEDTFAKGAWVGYAKIARTIVNHTNISLGNSHWLTMNNFSPVPDTDLLEVARNDSHSCATIVEKHSGLVESDCKQPHMAMCEIDL